MKKQTMGERLKELRTFYRLNQTDFGALIGLSHISVGKIENGLTTKPQAETLERIVNAFGTTYEWLEKGEGTMLPNGKANPSHDAKKETNPWESITYKELKESNTYLQRKLDETTRMLGELLGKIHLGKLNPVDLVALNNKRVSTGRVN